MPIQINDTLQNNSPKPDSAWYAKFVGGVTVPYSSVTEANTTIPPEYRSIGRTVLIDINGQNTEFWYKEGTGNEDLVIKTPETNVNITGSVPIETFGLSAATFSKTFTAGTILRSFIIDPLSSGVFTINIGTTEGGSEIWTLTVDTSSGDIPVNLYAKYFKTPQTWYFSNLPTPSQIKLIYESLTEEVS